MKDSNQSTIGKKAFCILITVFTVSLLVLAIWAIQMFSTAERFAKCDDGFSVWRRNPAAFASFRYETRNGISVIETNLLYKEIDSFLDEHNCLILGGG